MQSDAELKNVTLRFYEALSGGDDAAIERLISHQTGVLVIGTDPDEWWADYATIVQMFKAQMDEMGGGFPILAGDIQAYRDGNVGWVADRPALKLPDGNTMRFRMTAVLHREEGEWKFVQWHVSLGVSNQEAFGKELTV